MYPEEDKSGLSPRKGLGDNFTGLTKYNLYLSDYFSCMEDIWSFNSIGRKFVPSAPHYAYQPRALGQSTHKGLNISWAFLSRAFSEKQLEP